MPLVQHLRLSYITSSRSVASCASILYLGLTAAEGREREEKGYTVQYIQKALRDMQG